MRGSGCSTKKKKTRTAVTRRWRRSVRIRCKGAKKLFVTSVDGEVKDVGITCCAVAGSESAKITVAKVAECDRMTIWVCLKSVMVVLQRVCSVGGLVQIGGDAMVLNAGRCGVVEARRRRSNSMSAPCCYDLAVGSQCHEGCAPFRDILGLAVRRQQDLYLFHR